MAGRANTCLGIGLIAVLVAISAACSSPTSPSASMPSADPLELEGRWWSSTGDAVDIAMYGDEIHAVSHCRCYLERLYEYGNRTVRWNGMSYSGAVGSVSRSGHTISWSNGITWTRVSPPPVPDLLGLLGVWVAASTGEDAELWWDGTVIRVDSHTTALDNPFLEHADRAVWWGVPGVVSADGLRIDWSNGAGWTETWTRPSVRRDPRSPRAR